MTIRIDPALLEALKRKAKEEGRSASAEVVRLIRREVEARPATKRRRTGFGMFADFDSIEIHEVRALRRAVTTAWQSSIRKRGRR